MKRAIIAGFLAVLPLSVQSQPALNPEVIKDPVQRAEAWSRLLRAEREEHKREFPPPQCLKPDSTPEPCESRKATGQQWPRASSAPPKPSPPVQPLTPHNSLWLPPPEYDKPFKGKLTEIRVTPEIMRAICPKSQFPVTLACAYPPVHDTQCVIIMLEDKHLEAAGWTAEYVRRHEIGHCNGFPSDHRGARPLILSEREAQPNRP
jgi:hypothetical protein